MRHAGSFALKSPPTPTPAKTSLPAFSHRASAPSHPWQTGSTPAAFQLSRSHKEQAFFLNKACQDSLNSCSDSSTFNDLLLGSGGMSSEQNRLKTKIV